MLLQQRLLPLLLLSVPPTPPSPPHSASRLLLEHECLSVFVAYLDVESIREACKGWGTDDTALIRVLATRSKRALARVNIGYREACASLAAPPSLGRVCLFSAPLLLCR